MNNNIQIQLESSSLWWHFGELDPKCSMIFFDIVNKCKEMGVKVIITSMIRKKTTDSGIHAAKRAIDFILDTGVSDRAMVISTILNYINGKYEYRPGSAFKTLIYHKVGGDFGNFHFHLQVAS